jgi:GNAT superfamily N-acetyltransferase
MDIRLLSQSDSAALEEFLLGHRDSSMFLRSNARRAGLVDRGEPFQASYAAAFREGRIVAVAAQSWTGMVQVQAPERTAEVVSACVAASGRKVTGLSGPLEQVRRGRAALGLEAAPATLAADEGLFGLELSELVVPSSLANGTIVCRAPRPEERAVLLEWRVAYDIEALGATASKAGRERAAAFLDAQIADQNAWVALLDGVLVSLSAFNASLPDIVQLGGNYTPPELRGRGYARAVVAASLEVARERGASRAVLFTNRPSAIRCYQGLGFRRVGDFGLVFLA